jgi:hypothetical protein
MLINTQVVEVNTRTIFMNYSTAIDLTGKTNVFLVLNSSNGTKITANVEYSIDGVAWTMFDDLFAELLVPHRNKVIAIPDENIMKLPFIRIVFRIGNMLVENSMITISVYDVEEPPTGVYLDGSEFVHITGNGTTVAKSGAGILNSLLINISGVLTTRATIYDNTSGSGTVIAVVDTTKTSSLFMYNVSFSIGLTIVTSGGAVDLTVTYR